MDRNCGTSIYSKYGGEKNCNDLANPQFYISGCNAPRFTFERNQVKLRILFTTTGFQKFCEYSCRQSCMPRQEPCLLRQRNTTSSHEKYEQQVFHNETNQSNVNDPRMSPARPFAEGDFKLNENPTNINTNDPQYIAVDQSRQPIDHSLESLKSGSKYESWTSESSAFAVDQDCTKPRSEYFSECSSVKDLNTSDMSFIIMGDANTISERSHVSTIGTLKPMHVNYLEEDTAKDIYFYAVKTGTKKLYNKTEREKNLRTMPRVKISTPIPDDQRVKFKQVSCHELVNSKFLVVPTICSKSQLSRRNFAKMEILSKKFGDLYVPFEQADDSNIMKLRTSKRANSLLSTSFPNSSVDDNFPNSKSCDRKQYRLADPLLNNQHSSVPKASRVLKAVAPAPAPKVQVQKKFDEIRRQSLRSKPMEVGEDSHRRRKSKAISRDFSTFDPLSRFQKRCSWSHWSTNSSLSQNPLSVKAAKMMNEPFPFSSPLATSHRNYHISIVEPVLRILDKHEQRSRKFHRLLSTLY